MINIGSTDFYLGVPALPPDEFEEYSTRLFDDWESYVSELLTLPDYHLALDVQEGSISAKSKVLVAAGALYGGIVAYGSFISGLNTIHGQVKAVSEFFGERAQAPFASSEEKPKVRKSGGALTKLESLFVRVGNGSLTSDEAIVLAEKILGEEAKNETELMDGLRHSFEATPSQIQLPIEAIKTRPNETNEKEERSPKELKSRPVMIRPDRYRVEVWRESKKGKKNVRVRKL